ncbi:MAG: hypothetical protein ACRD0Z_10035 [Acidimicrobiales bacterium]
MTGGRSDATQRAVRPEHCHRAVPPVPSVKREYADQPLAVRCRVRLVGGEAGRAIAAAQGRALAALLTSLGPMEVGQGEEDRSP